jgi:serine/threonine protein kinase
MQEDRNETEFPPSASSLSPELGEKSAIKDPNLGTVVDSRYQLLENVGSGGSSTVYRARDSKSNLILALKLLHSHFVTDQLIVDRFKREAETSNLLRHPNVVEVESWAVSASGQVYMTEEFVEGISLQDAIAESGWLSVELALGIAAQVASGLVAAHEMGVVHCDLKPGNIMLTRSPEGMLMVKVLDFGIAKVMPLTGDTVLRLTQSGNMQGSLLYMSPEQCLDEDLDGRSDVYSLACVIYEALTGKSPLCARTAFETMNRHLSAMPAPLATVRADLRWPDKLEATLSRAYAKKPKDRYQSMAEFQSALKKVIDLPIEIEWPERWTARSERIDADLKIVEVVSAPIVSAPTFAPTNPVVIAPINPVVIAPAVRPKQAIEMLIAELGKIPQHLLRVVMLLMISVLFFMLAFMASQPDSTYNPVWFMLFGLVIAGFSSRESDLYLDSKNINLLKRVKLSGAADMVKRLEPHSIKVLEVTRFKSNFYRATIEVADSSGNVERNKVDLVSEILGEVWKAAIVAQVQETIEKIEALPAAQVASNPKLQYPLTGYLFCTSDGDEIAISIHSAVGWICNS